MPSTATVATVAASPIEASLSQLAGNMNPRTRDLFRTVVTCMRANGGSSKLTREPKSLTKAGLVVLVQKGLKTGVGGHRSRYSLTPAGIALAAHMFPIT